MKKAKKRKRKAPRRAARRVPRRAERKFMSPAARAADRARKLAILKDLQAKAAWRKAKHAAEKARELGEAALRKQGEAKEACATAKQALLQLVDSMNRRRQT
jgi:hypothetical protein